MHIVFLPKTRNLTILFHIIQTPYNQPVKIALLQL